MYNRVLKHIKAKDLRETISLRFTDVLNPVFWIGDSLRPEVREALMKFAKAFADYVDLDDKAISDVLYPCTDELTENCDDDEPWWDDIFGNSTFINPNQSK